MEWVGWGWVGLFLATGTARRRRQTDAAATGVAFRGRFSTSPVAVFSSFAICLFVCFFVVAVVFHWCCCCRLNLFVPLSLSVVGRFH